MGGRSPSAPTIVLFRPDLRDRYVPEIAGLPDRYIHRPWEAPPALLARAKIDLATTYPNPIIDHGAARDRPLILYQSIKDKAKSSSAKETAP